jgi:predicted AAA+ superfamily ATPase
MQRYSNQVIFDEVQRVPELFGYVKRAVDKDRQNYGKFILTGSSQFNLLKQISESLAGRIGLISLLPFQYSEMPEELRQLSIFKGAYPELVMRAYQGLVPWYSSYLTTYLEKDVRLLNNIGNLLDFQRLLALLAANTSQVLNYSSYAKNLGVSVDTVKRWISVLEASYIIFLLPPYFNNLGKRIVKSPKLYFYDTGLVSYLTGIETESQYSKGPMAGAIFENYVIAEIKKRTLHTLTGEQLYFYRSSNGLEVDLIIEKHNQRTWIEIKKSATFIKKMITPIEKLKADEDKAILLYQGERMPPFNNIEIMPVDDYLR